MCERDGKGRRGRECTRVLQRIHEKFDGRENLSRWVSCYSLSKSHFRSFRGRGGNEEREREREGHTISFILSNRVLVSFEFSSVKERELSRNDFQEILKHAENFSAHSSSVVCLLFVDYSEKRVAY